MRYTLNENIKRFRLQFGLNQVEFARRMCVTKQCVSNWENDNVLPSIEMLERMADFFHVSTDQLLGREDESSISVDGLTEDQKVHLRLIVKDLQEKNK